MRKWPAPGCWGPRETAMILSLSGVNSASVAVMSSPRRHIVLAERRHIVPVLWENQVGVARVPLEVDAEHLVCLPLVVLRPRPDPDQGGDDRVVPGHPFRDGDDEVLVAGLGDGADEVDDLELVDGDPVDPADRADVVEAELVSDEEGEVLDSGRRGRDLEPPFPHVVDLDVGEPPGNLRGHLLRPDRLRLRRRGRGFGGGGLRLGLRLARRRFHLPLRLGSLRIFSWRRTSPWMTASARGG